MKKEGQNSRFKSSLTLFAPLLTGLAASQILATGFVYQSNQRILQLAQAADNSHYFPLPAGPVRDSLSGFATAFWGGLFFTLSIGVGLTLLTWAALRLWPLLFRRSRSPLIVYALFWIGLLAFANLHGMALWPSLFCLLVPMSTACVSAWLTPVVHSNGDFSWMIPVAILAALTGLWTTQFNADLFIAIRDHILLSNPAGRRVNDFYYRYTLYAAEAFKSFQQKTLRSCNLEDIQDPQTARQWEKRLAQWDILVLPQIHRPDIRVAFSEKRIKLISPHDQGIETTPEAFIADPQGVLASFSKASDRLAPLRRMTLVGLLLGFPILLYVLVYGLSQTVATLLFSARRATWTASGACMVIGVLLFLPMRGNRPVTVTADNLNAFLAADQWTQRVAALRYIDDHDLDIAAYSNYRKLAASHLVVVRYWLARAMAKSRTDETYALLLDMLRDPHPNVICQAFYALGRQGHRQAIGPIKRRLLQLNHWYAQWYGYGAMRRLGWQQTRSK